ncbi:unnamed protein product, partial [Prorocentrum cordatum]
MGADGRSTSGPGSIRRSVRISSRATFNEGLFVLEAGHLPTGCGTAPSFGLSAEEGPGGATPPPAEIDIVGGVHRATHATTALRTGAGCDQSALLPGRDFSTKWAPGRTKAADSCDVREPGQFEGQGCAQSGPRNSVGARLNAGGGGTYALEWDPSAGHIRAWFWPVGAEPADVVGDPGGGLEPAAWGLPYAHFQLGQACPAALFRDMRLVFDLGFCGLEGIRNFELDCPEFATMTCQELVASRPECTKEAFWSLRSLRVYHRHGAAGQPLPSAPPSPPAAPTAGPGAAAAAARAAAAEARAAARAAPGRGPREPSAQEGTASEGAASAAPKRQRAAQGPDGAFPAVRRSGLALPGKVFGNRSAPLPTNAWWQNLALAKDTSSLEANVFQMPYVITAGSSSVNVMQPYPVQNSAAPFAQSFNEFEAMSLGFSDQDLSGPILDGWGQLSVSLGWSTPSGRGGMRAPLARGSPYVTAVYDGVTPLASSRQRLQTHGGRYQITVDGAPAPCDGKAPLRGSVFEARLGQSGAAWLLFSPAGAAWVCTPRPFRLAGLAPLRGAVRIALASGCSGGSAPPVLCSAGEAAKHTWPGLLRQHAGTYPTGAAVSYTVEGDAGSVVWEWQTESLAGWEPAELLQLAWPVHRERMSREMLRANSGVPDATPFHDVRGRATAVVGGRWRLDYELFPDVGLRSAQPIAEEMRAEILDALRGEGGALWNGSLADSEFDLPPNYRRGGGDTYFAGKMLARLARLVAVSDELGDAGRPYFEALLDRLSERLQVWLGPGAEAPFLYDSSWGGLVSCGCASGAGAGGRYCAGSAEAPETCEGLRDPGLNFGNGFYNDHHFHYGYFVYAAAVVARHRPEWERRWRLQIEALVRDYGNPTATDGGFPLARHMEWFMGFSWASGVSGPFFNGRSQDTSSEAVHAYYALYVYGASVDTPLARELRGFGRLLAAMEAHAARTYRFPRARSSVYGDMFGEGTVGTLWEHQAVFQSRFGGAQFSAIGMQLLPFTPMTESLLQEEWILEHLDGYKTACASDPACEATGWRWAVCLSEAVVDPSAARSCLRDLPQGSYGAHVAAANGDSLTNSLYWVATRPRRTRAPPAAAIAGGSAERAEREEDSALVLMKFKDRGFVLDFARRLRWASSFSLAAAAMLTTAAVACALARSRLAGGAAGDPTRGLRALAAYEFMHEGAADEAPTEPGSPRARGAAAAPRGASP